MEALRVTHADLPGGYVSFSDDEYVELEPIHNQIVVEQPLQNGQLAAPIYVGEEQFDFPFLFNNYYQETLQKLDLIRRLRGTFQIQPFIIEETTSFTVYWPQEPTMSERWRRGRRVAHWDKPILWREQRTVPCITTGS